MFHSHPRDKIYLAIIKYTYEEKGKRDGHVSGLNPDTLRRAHNLKGHAVADKSHTFMVDENRTAKGSRLRKGSATRDPSEMNGYWSCETVDPS